MSSISDAASTAPPDAGPTEGHAAAPWPASPPAPRWLERTPISSPVQGDLFARRWVMPALALSVYVVVLLLTRTLDQGDTSVYADSLVGHLRGRRATMWEFGHAIWRPLAYALFAVVHSDPARSTRGVLYGEAVRILTGLSVAGGAIAVVALQSWLRRIGVARGAAFGATAAFTATSAFIGYAQTGSSYIPALAMVLAGLRALADDDAATDRRTIVGAAVAFACAVLFWLPMVLAVPASAASMLILRGDSLRRRRVALAVCVISGLITVAVYVAIVALAGVRSVADFSTWMQSATHDIRGIGGVQRAIVGFARSLVNMGRLGLVAKRYLIGDPFNPATMSDVWRAGLARLVLLYAVLGVMMLVLAQRARTLRALWLFAATAVPVVGFALAWQGGDLERYLALFPATFLLVALALMRLTGHARVTAATAVALALVALNVPSISRARARADCALLSARLASVPRRDGAPTVILTPHELDEIATYRNRCPSADLLKTRTPPMAFGLVMANNARAGAWRDTLAARADRAWSRGGRVWISRRAFVAAPLPGWKWAEGDDPRLRWKDFPAFFGQLDVGPPVGGEDGFVELLPTGRTRAAIARLRRSPTS
jgi:hypothetical protein